MSGLSSHIFLAAKLTGYSTLAVLLVWAAAYVPLLLSLGYSYELHVVSSVVFTLAGLSILSASRSSSSTRVKVLLSIVTCVVLVEELLLNSVYALYGFSFALGGLILLPLFSVRFRGEGWLRVALEAYALVFATRIVLTPLPAGFPNLPAYLPTVYTLILLGVIFYMASRGIRSVDVRVHLGRCRLAGQLLLGFAAGALVGVVEYFILKPKPVLSGAPVVQTLAYIIIVLSIMVGVVEEFLFRGLLQTSLERGLPAWQAIGFASITFGLMHVGWMNPLEVMLAYGAGVLFGVLALLTDSLVSPITAHAVGNFVLYLIVMASGLM
ncbi:MAG: CPBP family intramembrane metalloprotease [Candidatus Bathyarchaeota archaeon]|nr:CPBP family intramembrane metalloprotease [Candidatus Bathyarchaeota archaeon]